MSVYDAIYARQSVDKADSISIESQIEFCKKETLADTVKIYADKGYSGKNTNRPQFNELLADIRLGCVERVIVYRLDRISRSVLDFANLIELFQKHNVSFVSTMEKFDTSTPIGKAMLMIVMIFAQLERETIQQRIVDAYSSRSKKGFYMGGAVPYGYTLQETIIDGVRTKMYAINQDEAKVVRLIYSLYKKPQNSLGDVARALEEQGIVKRDGKLFCRSRIRDLVINPIYVKADYSVYDFFDRNGTHVVNPADDFIGTNGAYLYSGDSEKRKSLSLDACMLVLAPHSGIVDSKTWLTCRSKCMKSSSASRPKKARQSFLAGKIKCGDCGYALVSKSYPRKNKEVKRYFLCSGKNSASKCGFHSLDADLVEIIVLNEIRNKLSAFRAMRVGDASAEVELLKLKAKIRDIESETNGLIDKLASANETLVKYINKRVKELDGEKSKILQQAEKTNKESRGEEIENYMQLWHKLSISDKMNIVDGLIEVIHAREGKLQITWKI